MCFRLPRRRRAETTTSKIISTGSFEIARFRTSTLFYSFNGDDAACTLPTAGYLRARLLAYVSAPSAVKIAKNRRAIAAVDGVDFELYSTNMHF